MNKLLSWWNQQPSYFHALVFVLLAGGGLAASPAITDPANFQFGDLKSIATRFIGGVIAAFLGWLTVLPKFAQKKD